MKKKNAVVGSTAALAVAAVTRAAPAITISSNDELNNDTGLVPLSTQITSTDRFRVPPNSPIALADPSDASSQHRGSIAKTMKLTGENPIPSIHLANDVLLSSEQKHLHDQAPHKHLKILLPLQQPIDEPHILLPGDDALFKGPRHPRKDRYNRASPTSLPSDHQWIIWRKPDGAFSKTRKGKFSNFRGPDSDDSSRSASSVRSTSSNLSNLRAVMSTPEKVHFSLLLPVIGDTHVVPSAKGGKDFDKIKQGEIRQTMQLVKRGRLHATDHQPPRPRDKHSLHYFGQPELSKREKADDEPDPDDVDDDDDDDDDDDGDGDDDEQDIKRRAIKSIEDENSAMTRRDMYHLSLGGAQRTPTNNDEVIVLSDDDNDDDNMSIRTPLTSLGFIFDVPDEAMAASHQPHRVNQEARNVFETQVRPFLDRRRRLYDDEAHLHPLTKRDVVDKRDKHYTESNKAEDDDDDDHHHHHHSHKSFDRGHDRRPPPIGRQRLYRRDLPRHVPDVLEQGKHEEGEEHDDELERRSDSSRHSGGSRKSGRRGGWRGGRRSWGYKRSIVVDNAPLLKRSIEPRGIDTVAPLTEANLKLLRRHTESALEYDKERIEKLDRRGWSRDDNDSIVTCSTHFGRVKCHRKHDDENDPERRYHHDHHHHFLPHLFHHHHRDHDHDHEKEHIPKYQTFLDESDEKYHRRSLVLEEVSALDKRAEQETTNNDDLQKRSATCHAIGGAHCYSSDGADEVYQRRALSAMRPADADIQLEKREVGDGGMAGMFEANDLYPARKYGGMTAAPNFTMMMKKKPRKKKGCKKFNVMSKKYRACLRKRAKTKLNKSKLFGGYNSPDLLF